MIDPNPAPPPVPGEPSLAVQEQVFQMVGFDVPRQWATSAQAFKLDGAVMIIFREVMAITGVPTPGELPLAAPVTAQVSRNIGSVVVPAGIAAELGRILATLTAENVAAENAAV
jgi:hypothetical protein